MNMFARATVCAVMTLLCSCQTKPEPGFPTTITGIEKTIYVDATCSSDVPILIARSDILSLATAEQIGDHNNDLWCRCPEKRPTGFDAKICKV